MSMTYRAISSHLTGRPADQQATTTQAVTRTPEPQPFGCTPTITCTPWEGLYMINEGTPPVETVDDNLGGTNQDLEHFLATLMYGE